MSRFRALIVLVLAMVSVGAVFAIDDATLRIARVDGAGFRARDLTARVDLTDASLAVEAHVAELTLSSGAQHLRDVHIVCPALTVSDLRIACDRAELDLVLPELGKQRLHASLDYGRTDGSLRATVQGLRLGSGQADVRVALVGERWTAAATLRNAAVESLLNLATKLGTSLPEITGTGVVSLRANATGTNADVLRVSHLKVDGEVRELTLANASGTLASDKLQLQLKAELRRRGADWNIDTTVRSAAGQAYFEPVFLDLGVHEFSASANGRWTKDGVLALQRFAIDHTSVLQATGAAEIVLSEAQPVRALQLSLKRLQFPGAYESYLQPFLVNTSFKSMSTLGAIAAEITVEHGVPRAADVRLDELSFDDGNGSLGLSEVSGTVHWRDESHAQASRLQFANGTLLGLQLGAAEVSFRTDARNVRLLQPTRIPIFDGAIELESFRVRNAGTPNVAFLVDATIHPISVPQLCRAFGWPEFGGQIGGVISKLRLREGVVTLGTTLEASVFNGSVRLSDLRLEEAFGQWPRFFANIELEKLDLELVTQAFSFGKITGLLSGSVRELRLFNWTPVAFDASLYTPADDRSRHRISQRAVENIGSLGGGGAGVTAALSSGFLRFFEEFNYDRLGVSCRLQNEVCYMDGVAPAPHDAYYLVKGKGLPRIDVIASTRRVDWPRLLSQLKAATESGGPSVQ